MTGAIPLLIDCDTGIDDALALLLACASPEADVRVVTCVAGNVDAHQVAINTRAVLELAGRPDIEVALGREVPLLRTLQTTPETHGGEGLGDARLPPPRAALSPRHAADVIVAEATAHPGELTLLALGPMTNLAVAVLREPRLPRLLRRLVLMGGAYGAAGNTTPVAEWNVAVDPEAMAVVLRAWAPDGPMAWGDDAPPLPLALGLDVTEQARFLPEHLGRLAARAGCGPDGTPRGGGPRNPVVGFVADALGHYFRFHERFDGFRGAFIHDPLALAAALDPTLVSTRPLAVEVHLGGIADGQTIADRRDHWGRPPNLDVAVAADVPAFVDRFIERVGGLAASRSGVAG
ncbi:MAG: nucleoside hydrolase [Chloroflexota bacterium]